MHTSIYRHLAKFISDDIKENHYIEAFKIPKSELEVFLDQYATIDSIILHENNKPILVYRIIWD